MQKTPHIFLGIHKRCPRKITTVADLHFSCLTYISLSRLSYLFTFSHLFHISSLSLSCIISFFSQLSHALLSLSCLSLSFHSSLTSLLLALTLFNSRSLFLCLLFFFVLCWSEMAMALSATITTTVTIITRPVRCV